MFRQNREEYDMKFDVEKAKELMKIFGHLNETNQKELILKAYEMEFDQNAKKQLSNSGIVETNKSLVELKMQLGDRVEGFLNLMDDMGPNQQAVLAFAMDEITKGDFTKEEYIDFIVGSRKLSVSEYIEKYIPGADVEEAKKIYNSIKKDMLEDNE